MAKSKFSHLKYIDLSPDYAPEYVQYEIYIGGATSTAVVDNLKKWAISDFEGIYACNSVEQLHNYITDFNN